MRIFLTSLLAVFLSSAGCHAASAQTSKYGAPSSHTPNSGAIQLPISTVTQLPACDAYNVGILRMVSDATTPTFNATLVGGGAVKALALCNGTNWISP